MRKQYLGWTSRIFRQSISFALLVVVGLGQVIGAIPYARAQAASTVTLYAFKGGSDGAVPLGDLVRDAAGNLYGTTKVGGAFHIGTVFKLDAAGKETILHSFAGGTDGVYPEAGLVRDAAGNLYGTTLNGGSPCSCGTVFKIDATGTETVLYSFIGGADGATPFAGVIRDAAGNLYGATETGGGSNFGMVFKLDTTGKETLLYRFAGGTDGAYPNSSLVRDAAGNLYGTTTGGGTSNYGTVFKLDTTGKETVLYRFASGTDGAYPFAGLILDKAGNLYGTTQYGGTSNYGTVFKLDPTGTETVLYSFGQKPDGEYPVARLIRDGAGNLYGTTSAGGLGYAGYGTVFKLDPTGTETVLHRFAGTDGSGPVAGLVRDRAGNLYGTTDYGGLRLGAVFRVGP